MKRILVPRLIDAKETYAVRQPVLRQGRPLADCKFEGDGRKSTFHIGGFYDGEMVATASFLANGHPEHGFIDAYQLRGMAVLQKHQGHGFGKILLTFGEQLLIDKEVQILWMNARVEALDFYKNLGYSVIGNIFDIPQVGKHYVLFKKLKT